MEQQQGHMHWIQCSSVTMPEQRLRLKNLLSCVPEGAQPETGVPVAFSAETWEKWEKSVKVKQNSKISPGFSAPAAWHLKLKSVVGVKNLLLPHAGDVSLISTEMLHPSF